MGLPSLSFGLPFEVRTDRGVTQNTPSQARGEAQRLTRRRQPLAARDSRWKDLTLAKAFEHQELTPTIRGMEEGRLPRIRARVSSVLAPTII